MCSTREYNEMVSTNIFHSFCTICVPNDTGQEDFEGIRDQYARSNDGFMLVFDITKKESFDGLIEYL